MSEKSRGGKQRIGLKLLGAVTVGIASLTACGGEAATPAKTTTTTIILSPGFTGGCDKFRVYAQNRWAPLGAAERQTPDVLAKKIGGFAGNEVIAVDGWLDTGKPAYPTNTSPWNSSVWFHLANEDGWVSFAGVRAEPTATDPTGLADGGPPASTPAACQLHPTR